MKREPLTQEQKESIYKYKLQGHTLKEVAKIVGCSLSTARKWWRKGRDNGLAGLQATKYGTSKKGTLCFFEKIVAQKALAYKRSHPKWGADRVLIELKKDPELKGLRLPKRRSLATFFKEECPECVRVRKPAKKVVPSPPPKAAGVHEIWQVDTQEGIRLKNGEIASICNIRDPFSGAMIASCAFSVKTKKHWRKLTLNELRSVLRLGFGEWKTLPVGILTDNELLLAGSPTDSYPSQLTLWLIGLGIKHSFIRPHKPTVK